MPSATTSRAVLVVGVALILLLPTAAVAAPPANDAYVDAMAFPPLPGAVGGDNTEATDVPGDPRPSCALGDNAHATLWYTLDLTAGEQVTLDTDSAPGTLVDTVLAIYSGTPPTTVEHACDDDDGAGLRSTIEFTVPATDTYTIGVAGWGSSRGTFTLTIESRGIPPVVDAGGPYQTDVGVPVELTATGSDPDGGDVFYEWDLDGAPGFETVGDTPGATVTYPADAVGEFPVSVRITDDEGQTATDTTTVRVLGPPDVDAGGPYQTSVGVPVDLTATGSDPDGGDVFYEWDLNGGPGFETVGDTPGATVTYPADTIGEFLVSVRITDDEGATAVDTTTVTVTDAPTVDAGGPYATQLGVPVDLTATGSDPDGGDVFYEWDLDGAPGFETVGDTPGATVTFPADAYGQFEVVVRVTDDEGETATDSTTVTVTDPPTVDAGGPYVTRRGTPIDLTATGSDPDGGDVFYEWDLTGAPGFETVGDTPGATVTYPAEAVGEFEVSVRITDDDGETAVDTTTVTVLRREPSPGPGPVDPPTPPVVEVGDTDDSLDDDDVIDLAIRTSQIRFSGLEFAQTRVAASVVIARVDIFADALGGSVLTGRAPLLYTAGASLDARTAAEVDRVLGGAGTVYLLGGPAALSPDVEASLVADGYTVVRLAGPTRVETALAVADAAPDITGQALPGVGLARADDWADAITAGGWAAETGQPILVTQTDVLHPAVAAWLAAHDDLPVTALGGQAALSDDVVAQADATRVSGPNRYGTAASIAQQLWASRDAGYVITNGTDPQAWAYTLAVAGLAADRNQPTLLVDVSRLPAETEAQRCAGPTPDLTIVGPLRLIDQSVRDQLEAPCA